MNEDFQVTNSQTNWMTFNTLSVVLRNIRSQLLDFVGRGNRCEACAAVHVSSTKHGICFVYSVDTANGDFVSLDGEAGTCNEMHVDEISPRTSNTVNNYSFQLPSNSNLSSSLTTQIDSPRST